MNDPTRPKRANEPVTRLQHLSRLEAHARWLVRRATIELALGSRDDADRKHLAHTSLRWLIEREQARS